MPRIGLSLNVSTKHLNKTARATSNPKQTTNWSTFDAFVKPTEPTKTEFGLPMAPVIVAASALNGDENITENLSKLLRNHSHGRGAACARGRKTRSDNGPTQNQLFMRVDIHLFVDCFTYHRIPIEQNFNSTHCTERPQQQQKQQQ